MRKLGDAALYLIEDMLVYFGLFVFTFSFDFMVNLAIASRLYPATHEPDGHPYSLGILQILFMSFCLFQFARKCWDFVRYYK